ncbi:Gfo/Idh/MocA family oxidoreductase [Nocardia sp. NPDC004568]|uniref:Gfo/Idh/MocA family protein n=1 Tax=Nocardia sp. NPDC004568 TaxID=3154551 RepID=UPI0033BFB205
MRIGFAGVAHSHPFSDARNARTLGVDELTVWDPDDHSRRADFAREWQATTYESLADLLDREPDAVIVTPRPYRIAPVVAAVLDRGIACFLNKVPAADMAGLDALDAAVGDRAGRFFTSSVLRFAPGIRALAAELAGAEPIAAHISVRHGIDAFTTAARRWQDDPADGGGTAVSMGLHAWELLDSVLGREVTPLGGVTARIPDSATISENTVALHAVAAGGVPVTVDIVGAGTGECYEVVVHTEAGIRRVSLGQADDLGYLDCLRAVLAMADGAPPPVPWARSRAVVRTTLTAAQLARTGD